MRKFRFGRYQQRRVPAIVGEPTFYPALERLFWNLLGHLIYRVAYDPSPELGQYLDSTGAIWTEIVRLSA